MISVARIQTTSTSAAGQAVPPPQLPSKASGAQVPSFNFIPSADEELDEDELDREIRGYASNEDTGDDSEVEVNSDDFEVVGVIYDSESEESCEEEEEDKLSVKDPLGAPWVYTPSSADEEGSSDNSTSADGGEDEYEDVHESEQNRSAAQESTQASPTPLRRSSRLAKRKWESEEEEESSSDDEDYRRPPPIKKACGRGRASDGSARTRMTQAEADSYKKTAESVSCGIGGCKELLAGWKMGKTHLEKVHYASERRAERAEKAGSKDTATAQRKGNGTAARTGRKGKGKENIPTAGHGGVQCRYTGCSHSSTTVNQAYRHIKTVHWLFGASVCPGCGKTYSRLDSLRRHLDDGCSDASTMPANVRLNTRVVQTQPFPGKPT
ncbi:hypothetical protein C8Q73DRAFT_664358 [Cubamyces lactineus]|nr:hypothetical protein C8Q73DRAFT_664358 [Cubamyces lactineus]